MALRTVDFEGGYISVPLGGVAPATAFPPTTPGLKRETWLYDQTARAWWNLTQLTEGPPATYGWSPVTNNTPGAPVQWGDWVVSNAAGAPFAPYTTIEDALAAIVAAGVSSAVVTPLPGVYTPPSEQLTMPPNVSICALGPGGGGVSDARIPDVTIRAGVVSDGSLPSRMILSGINFETFGLQKVLDVGGATEQLIAVDGCFFSADQTTAVRLANTSATTTVQLQRSTLRTFDGVSPVLECNLIAGAFVGCSLDACLLQPLTDSSLALAIGEDSQVTGRGTRILGTVTIDDGATLSLDGTSALSSAVTPAVVLGNGNSQLRLEPGCVVTCVPPLTNSTGFLTTAEIVVSDPEFVGPSDSKAAGTESYVIPTVRQLYVQSYTGVGPVPAAVFDCAGIITINSGVSVFPIVVLLPVLRSRYNGVVYRVVNVGANAVDLIFTPDGTDEINGANAPFTLTAKVGGYGWVDLVASNLTSGFQTRPLMWLALT